MCKTSLIIIALIIMAFSTSGAHGQSNNLKHGTIGYFIQAAIEKAREKKYEEAIDIVDSAIAIDTNNENVYQVKAEFLWMKEDYFQAAVNYQKAMSLDKDSSFLRGAYLQLGVLYEKAGYLEEAQSNYIKAIYLFENVKRENDRFFEYPNRIDYATVLILSGNDKKWNQLMADPIFSTLPYSTLREKYNGKTRTEILEIYWEPFKGN